MRVIKDIHQVVEAVLAPRRVGARVGDERDVVERGPGTDTREPAAGDAKRAQRHPMKGAGEGEDTGSPSRAAGDLQGRLDRVGTCRPRRQEPEVEVVPAEQAVDRTPERLARRCLQIERVGQAVAREVVEQDTLEPRVVMPEVQGAGAAEEVDELVPVLIPDPTSPGGNEVRGVDAGVVART